MFCSKPAQASKPARWLNIDWASELRQIERKVGFSVFCLIGKKSHKRSFCENKMHKFYESPTMTNNDHQWPTTTNQPGQVLLSDWSLVEKPASPLLPVMVGPPPNLRCTPKSPESPVTMYYYCIGRNFHGFFLSHFPILWFTGGAHIIKLPRSTK